MGNPIEYAFGLRQASAKAEEVCLVQEIAAIYPVPGQTSPAAAAAPPAGALFILAQASAEAEEVYPGTRPNFATPAGALFTTAQTGVTQTGACLPSRRLRTPKQAPVYLRADRSEPNRRLFTLAQASAEAGKFAWYKK